MIDLVFNLATGTARLTASTIVKVGADVPVRITFSSAPGMVGTLQLALGSDAAPPAVLAFTGDFIAESATVWTALLDASDTRLAAHLDGKPVAAVNAEIVAVLDGVRIVTPNIPVTVQQALLNGPASSEGGPDYYTEAEVDALLAAGRPQFFSAAIANGASTVAVVFATAFAAAPVIGGALVAKALLGDGDLSVVGFHGLSAAGVTFDLSAAAPAGTYVLHGSAQLL